MSIFTGKRGLSFWLPTANYTSPWSLSCPTPIYMFSVRGNIHDSYYVIPKSSHVRQSNAAPLDRDLDSKQEVKQEMGAPYSTDAACSFLITVCTTMITKMRTTCNLNEDPILLPQSIKHVLMFQFSFSFDMTRWSH